MEDPEQPWERQVWLSLVGTAHMQLLPEDLPLPAVDDSLVVEGIDIGLRVSRRSFQYMTRAKLHCVTLFVRPVDDSDPRPYSTIDRRRRGRKPSRVIDDGLSPRIGFLADPPLNETPPAP